jgi:hypothetical protein
LNHEATGPGLNAKAQRRKGAKDTHPQLNAETQRRRDAGACLPGLIARRGPGRRTARDRRTGAPLQPPAIVAAPRTADIRSVERRPRRFSSPSDIGCAYGSLLSKGRARRNRRAPGASAGGTNGSDGRLRPELTWVPPVVSDRMIADVSAVNPGHLGITSATTSLRLCAFAVIWVGGRLCVSALCSSGLPVCSGVSCLGMIPQ